MSKVILSKDASGVLNVRSSSIADAQDVYTAKAWVNFNGTGTVAIRGSGNVSSITDNGTGDWSVNFITAMPDANYSITGITGSQNTSGWSYGLLGTQQEGLTASYARIRTVNALSAGTFVDESNVLLAVFR